MLGQGEKGKGERIDGERVPFPLTLSPLTHFNIAKVSAGEVRSLLRVALEIGYLNEETYSRLSQQVIEISKMLFKQIESLNASL